MILFSVVLEDIMVIGTRNEKDWEITATCEGSSITCNWTDTQVGAVLALATAGDDCAEIEALRPIAEKAIEGWPSELRVIP